MHIIGITGSIGMGKSFITNFMKNKGIEVFDADDVVKQLYEDRKIINKLKNLFKFEIIDKITLQQLIKEDPLKREILERFIHPLVEQKLQIFLKKVKLQNKNLVVIDIPLLFEKNYEKYCSQIIVVFSTPRFQVKRLLQRPNMTPEKIFFFEKLQLPSYKKRFLADKMLNTTLSKDRIFWQLIKIIQD